ncbi:phosphoesterase, MJ0936 family [Longilinea arvoryzae]|uniref:Phosphoesterase n=1 Tax=Longilinea arvoryzae TaxID=360412 RepID=A0A0S7BMZ4_9CHLR|nr:metallophosphoesterase family protein [Longilinea arvoryzae]GAP15329.1 phosphoesterase, MJ0936 family [Longilinea arvoryzae]
MGDSNVTVAVVADTHVPDRVGMLHPNLIPMLSDLHPNLILHGGDVCSPAVLDTLRQVAPVEAVRGNRDWLLVKELPLVRKMVINGIQVTLQHGHGNLFDYLIDKWHYLRQGYRFERYARIVRKSAGTPRVIVFGHTHHAECIWEENVLWFNPGSASLGPDRKGYPSFGVLRFSDTGQVEGEIHTLGKLKWDGQNWTTFG